MNCPYTSNSFYRNLSSSVQKSLCSRCHLRTYAKRQHLNYRYWERLTAVLLDGLMVFGEYDSAGRFSTSGLAAAGTLISPGVLVDVWNEPGSDRDVLCLMDCHVAVFDTDYVRQLFQTDVGFIKAVYDNIHTHCSVEKQRFLLNVGGRDSLAAVRYILDWCRENSIPALTHEQIALMCNRSRPTVTELMHTLLMQEPELFRGEADIPKAE